MKVTGKIVGANIDFKTGKPTLTLSVNELNDFKNLVDELGSADKLSIEIKPYRERRSLDANAYFWVLCSKLADKVRLTKEQVYRECIRDIGGNSEIVCVRNDAVNKLRDGWQRNGLGWITDVFPSKLEGCTNVELYYGSSTYDTKQMSDLISIVVDACKENGIETMTPSELALLVERWGE